MSPPSPSAEPPFADVPDPVGAALAAHEPAVPLPEQRPTRAELRARGRLALILALAWLAVEFGWFGVRGDLVHVSFAYVLAMVLAPIVAALLCLLIALAAGRLGMGASVGLIAGASLVPPLALLAAVPLFSPAVATGAPGSSPGEIATCFNLTLSFTLLPMLAAGVALRRTFVRLARWRSALVGTAAGLAGAALVNLHCERVGSVHIALGHLGAAVAVALLGAFVLARVTRV